MISNLLLSTSATLHFLRSRTLSRRIQVGANSVVHRTIYFPVSSYFIQYRVIVYIESFTLVLRLIAAVTVRGFIVFTFYVVIGEELKAKLLLCRQFLLNV